MIDRISDCLEAARLLYERGLVNAFEGNVSVRLGDTALITPTRMCKSRVSADDLVEIELAGGRVVRSPRGHAPSSEWRLHLACYRARPGIVAVAHAHPPYATSFALRREPIETSGYPEAMVLYGKIPVCAYGRPGTDAVTCEVPAALATADAFLLANHGLVAVASSAMEAAYMLEGIESIAKTLHIARRRGGECPLSPAEASEIEKLRLTSRKV